MQYIAFNFQPEPAFSSTHPCNEEAFQTPEFDEYVLVLEGTVVRPQAVQVEHFRVTVFVQCTGVC